MSFITESELSNYRSRNRTFPKDDNISLKESITRDKTRPTVFLSHKHDEVVILQDVIGFLKQEGIDVYVDWMDEEMPAHTNAKTAIRLKNKIKASNKFVLVATHGAINSKWCNWELGLGDAAKYIENIALLPINRTYQSFVGSEYLKIYPYIDFEDGTGKYLNDKYIPRGYYVKTTQDAGTVWLVPLREWLRS